MFEEIFARLDAERIHSVTLGSFRLPQGFHKTMQALYPDHWLLASGLTRLQGMVSYTEDIQVEMMSYCSEKLASHLPSERIHQYAVSGENTHV